MTTFIFWPILLVIMFFAVVQVRNREKSKCPVHIYALLSVLVFQLFTIVHVRRFLFRYGTGNMDAILSLGVKQIIVNPFRIVLGFLPKKWIYLPATDSILDERALVITLNLFEVIIYDMFLGSLFWFLVVYGIIALCRR